MIIVRKTSNKHEYLGLDKQETVWYWLQWHLIDSCAQFYSLVNDKDWLENKDYKSLDSIYDYTYMKCYSF